MYKNRPLLQDRGRRGGEVWIGGGLDLNDKCLRVALLLWRSCARARRLHIRARGGGASTERRVDGFSEATTRTSHLNSTLMFNGN